MNEHAAQLIRLQSLSSKIQIRPRARAAQKEVQRLRAQIPETLLRGFDRLIRQGRIAVATLSPSGACGNCHLNLPPATAAKVRHAPEQIHTCPHCGCLLYDAAWTSPIPPEVLSQDVNARTTAANLSLRSP